MKQSVKLRPTKEREREGKQDEDAGRWTSAGTKPSLRAQSQNLRSESRGASGDGGQRAPAKTKENNLCPKRSDAQRGQTHWRNMLLAERSSGSELFPLLFLLLLLLLVAQLKIKQKL